VLSEECWDLAVDAIAKVEHLGLPRDALDELRAEILAMLQWRLDTGLARHLPSHVLFPLVVCFLLLLCFYCSYF
jgi:hypothetical protein